MELQVGVKALIKDSEGRYLFLKRVHPYEGEAEPRWDIPGGRIDPGKPIGEALAREIKEETGLIMKGTPVILYAQDILRIKNKHIVRLTFKATVGSGEVKLDTSDPNGTGHNDYGWFTVPEIKKLYYDKYLASVIDLLENSKSE